MLSQQEDIGEQEKGRQEASTKHLKPMLKPCENKQNNPFNRRESPSLASNREVLARAIAPTGSLQQQHPRESDEAFPEAHAGADKRRPAVMFSDTAAQWGSSSPIAARNWTIGEAVVSSSRGTLSSPISSHHHEGPSDSAGIRGLDSVPAKRQRRVVVPAAVTNENQQLLSPSAASVQNSMPALTVAIGPQPFLIGPASSCLIRGGSLADHSAPSISASDPFDTESVFVHDFLLQASAYSAGGVRENDAEGRAAMKSTAKAILLALRQRKITETETAAYIPRSISIAAPESSRVDPGLTTRNLVITANIPSAARSLPTHCPSTTNTSAAVHQGGDSRPAVSLDDSMPAVSLDDSRPAVSLDDSRPAVSLDDVLIRAAAAAAAAAVGVYQEPLSTTHPLSQPPHRPAAFVTIPPRRRPRKPVKAVNPQVSGGPTKSKINHHIPNISALKPRQVRKEGLVVLAGHNHDACITSLLPDLTWKDNQESLKHKKGGSLEVNNDRQQSNLLISGNCDPTLGAWEYVSFFATCI